MVGIFGGIGGAAIGAVNPPQGLGTETDPFSGISMTSQGSPAAAANPFDVGGFDAAGFQVGADDPFSGGNPAVGGPSTNVTTQPFGPFTPSAFDASKFGLGNFDINTPGGNFSFDPKTGFNFESGLGGLRSERSAAFKNAAEEKERFAESLNFAPLTKARLAEFDRAELQIEREESEAIGGLRDQLASRRVLGSSFATAQQKREKNSFAQRKDDLRAQRSVVAGESKLQEFQMRQQALTEANQLRIQQFQVEITEVFGETELAVQAGTQFASLMEANLRARMAIEFADLEQTRALAQQERQSLRGDFAAAQERDARSSAGFGSLIGSLLTAPGGSLIGGLFG